MKRLLSLIFSVAFILFFANACKDKSNTEMNTVIGAKFAKYRVSVRKSENLKDWLATLEKAEEVKLLEEFEQTSSKNEVVTIAKVQLADDSIGFIEARHLANDPVVFLEDTKVFTRPISTSAAVVTLPKGSIGFILEEKDGWTKVYVGKVEGQWITKQWVESGKYTVDAPLVVDAREYETALNLIGEKKYEEAREKLDALAGGVSFFASLAAEKLVELEAAVAESMDEEMEGSEQPQSDTTEAEETAPIE